MASSISSRSSFDENCQKENKSPPSRLLKSIEGSYNDYYYERFLTTSLGFSRSEFLPLTSKKIDSSSCKNSESRKFNSDGLSDDVLGLCLFSGFLNTFETARLACVNKRVRKIAASQVKQLDLRNCHHLTKAHIETIASTFQNLSVSVTSSIMNWNDTIAITFLYLLLLYNHSLTQSVNIFVGFRLQLLPTFWW